MLKLAAVQHSGCVLRNIVARPWLVCSQSHRPNFGLASRAVTTAPGTTGIRAHCMKKGVEGQVSVVYVTVPAPGADDVAKTLASSIIENKLAACVNIVPGVTSVYWWEGKVEHGSEQLLIVKTASKLVESLTKHVQANHPYDECEVISTAVTGGSASYLDWVLQSTTVQA